MIHATNSSAPAVATSSNYDVFLCHNSADKAFIREVAEGLELEFGIPHFLDDYAIPIGEPFLPWIEKALEESTGCAIFLGGNGWGPTHAWEADLALGRYRRDREFRLIPVILPGVSEEDLQRLGSVFQEINWVDFRRGAGDARALERLRRAITGDVESTTRGPAELTPYLIRRDAARWRRRRQQRARGQHSPTGLPQFLKKWHARLREEGLLYRGAQLLEAQRITTENPDLVVGEEVAAFLTASTLRQRNRWRFTAAVATGVGIVLAVLAIFLQMQRLEVIRQRDDVLRNQSLFLANNARQQAAAGETTLAIQLALEGLPRNVAKPTRPRLPQAEAALFQVIESYRSDLSLPVPGDGVTDLAFSPDGKALITSSADGLARIWDVESGKELVVISAEGKVWHHGEWDPESRLVALAGDGTTVEILKAASGQIRNTLSGHDAEISDASFSPDGLQIATASKDATARVWQAETGMVLQVLRGHDGAVLRVAFSPNGQQILTASEDRTARLWNAHTGNLDRVLEGHPEALCCAEFIGGGETVLTASFDGSMRLWETASGKEVARFGKAPALLRDLAVHPGGETFATASADGTARLWRVDSLQPVAVLDPTQGLDLLDADLLQVEFSPDGSELMTVLFRMEQFLDIELDDSEFENPVEPGLQGMVHLWDGDDGTLIRVLAREADEVIFAATFSPNGRRVATASSARARILKLATGRPAAVLEGHEGVVRRAAFSPDGKLLVTAAEDHTARIWHVPTGENRATLRGHQAYLWSTEFSPDGRWIVTASGDHTARLWDVQGGKSLHLLPHDGVVWHAAFAPHGHRVVTSSADRKARLWNTETGELAADLLGHTGVVRHAAFSPTEPLVATASFDRTVRLWRSDTGVLERIFHGHSNGVTSVTFSPDGRKVASTSYDGSARLWETATGEAKVLAGHDGEVWSAAFSPDGRVLLTTSLDTTARLWNVASGRTIGVLEHFSAVGTGVFRDDGELLVTASGDHQARVWLAASQQLIATLAGHEAEVLSATFSPDGRWIATASWDHTARIWHAPVTSQAAIDLGRSLIGDRPLTEAERRRFFLVE